MGMCAMALGLCFSFALSACSSDDQQANMRKTVYATQSAYQVLTAPIPDIIAGKDNLVKLTDTQAVIAAKASQSMLNQINSMVSETKSGATLTDTALSSLTTAWSSFQSCWAGIKLNTIPADCAVFTTLPTTDTVPGAAATYPASAAQ